VCVVGAGAVIAEEATHVAVHAAGALQGHCPRTAVRLAQERESGSSSSVGGASSMAPHWLHAGPRTPYACKVGACGVRGMRTAEPYAQPCPRWPPSAMKHQASAAAGVPPSHMHISESCCTRCARKHVCTRTHIHARERIHTYTHIRTNTHF